MGDWHCTQIPNGQQPIVVCEREALTAEIVRLRAAGDALCRYVVESGPGLHDDEAVIAYWNEARRG